MPYGSIHFVLTALAVDTPPIGDRSFQKVWFLLGAIAILLIVFTTVLLLITLRRRRRFRETAQVQPREDTSIDPWVEAGRRAEPFPHHREKEPPASE